MAGSDARMVLAALPVGLQLWESAGDGGLALAWANRDDDADRGEGAARAALARRDGRHRRAVPRRRTAACGRSRWATVVCSSASRTSPSWRRPSALSSSIVACLHQALIVVNTDGRITRSNDAAADLCGVSLGELTGSSAARPADQRVRARRPAARPDRLADLPRAGRPTPCAACSCRSSAATAPGGGSTSAHAR